jgi:hypothetical protein
MTRPYLTSSMTMKRKVINRSADDNMGDHLKPDQTLSKLQELLDENRNVFMFMMEAMTTIRRGKFKVTLTNDTPTLEMLGPATLGLGGELGPINESAQGNDTVAFHPTKVDESEAKPSRLGSQAMEVVSLQSKLEAIAKTAPPMTVSGLRAFLGAAGYYQRYFSNYPRITVPLNALLQSGVAWEWTPEAQQAFEELKATLTIKAQACKICQGAAVNGRTGAMLMCDNCNTRWHMKCLTPPLRKKPAGKLVTCSRCPVAG